MKELAEAITQASAIIQENYHKFRDLEARAQELRQESDAQGLKLRGLLDLQTTLIDSPRITEFGLPSGMSPEDFETFTGHKITS